MRVWSVTDRGLVRSENQDACAVLTPDGYTVAVVCDGMGGTQGGRMASAIAVETFTRELSRSLRPGMSAGQLEQAAGYAVALSNDAVREYGLAHPGFERMGTTLVSAVVRDDLALVSNIGDSRAYHITREGIRQVSRDHSVVEDMVEKGEFEKVLSKRWDKKVYEVYFRRNNRIFYVTADRDNIYLLHVCRKQKNKTERVDKNIVLARARELGGFLGRKIV